MQSAVKGLEKLEFRKPQEFEYMHASVYGSKYAAGDLPKNEMPETEMPREVSNAQRLSSLMFPRHVYLFRKWSANSWPGGLSHDQVSPDQGL